MDPYPVVEWGNINGITGLRAIAAAVGIPHQTFKLMSRALTGCSAERAYSVEEATEKRTPGRGISADRLLRWHRKWNRRKSQKRAAPV